MPAINDPSKRKVALESKRRELNAGDRLYEVEMLRDPIAAGLPFFDRAVIERLLPQCTDAKDINASLHLMGEF